MDFLIRFVQQHVSFRRAEITALGQLHGIKFEIIHYEDTSPYCIVQLPDAKAAEKLVTRSILVQSIHELLATGKTYEEVHTKLKKYTIDKWHDYKNCTFKFSLDAYQGSRNWKTQKDIIESFSYLPFDGKVQMSEPEVEFTVFEFYNLDESVPTTIHMGRLISKGARDLINQYTLKRRRYIATTSMDSELALVGANLVLAAPGKLIYDPFVGTASLTIACAHFGAQALGSDLDGRCIRGKMGNNVKSSFSQYNLSSRYLDGFVSDITHSPLRKVDAGWLDSIVCDPPYGVREGLKVLGSRDKGKKEILYINGQPAHLAESYIPPTRQYSFEAMLVDILQFAAEMLVENGRISMWMPTANDEEQELVVPHHPALDLVSICIQPFNKWSRRLLVYRKKCQAEVTDTKYLGSKPITGRTADELNRFRKKFFLGFKASAELNDELPAC